MSELVIRVDANPEIALGHLRRCVSLAKALQKKGVEVLMVCSSDPAGDRMLSSSGIPWCHVAGRMDSPEDALETAGLTREHGARVVLLDSYSAGPETIETFRSAGLEVVCIDDLGQTDLPCDLVINGLPGAERLEYCCPVRLLGKDYLILAPEYWRPRPKESLGRELLVTMGGIDHYDYSSLVLEKVKGLRGDFGSTIIIGPYYENTYNIEAAADELGDRVRLVRSPDSLYPFMQEAGAAVSAGGMTLYELAAMGVPTLGIALWENQYVNVRELGAKGVIEPVWHGMKEFGYELDWALHTVLFDEKRREEMSRRGQEAFDGQGAMRVAKGILNLIRNTL